MAEVKPKKKRKTPAKKPKPAAYPAERVVETEVAVPNIATSTVTVQKVKVVSRRDRKGSIGPYKFEVKAGKVETVPKAVADALIADGTCVRGR